MRRVLVLAVVAALTSTACGPGGSNLNAADSTTTSSQRSTSTEAPAEPLSADSRIGADGIHPLMAGMTMAEVRQAAGAEVVVEGFDDFEGYCWFARIKGLEEDFSLLFLAPERTAPVGDPDEGVLGRASTYADLDSSPARSTGGPGIGSTKDEVMEVYAVGPGHSVEVTPHQYTDGGEYIDVRGAKYDDGQVLRFETDGAGRVTAVHGGLEDAVQLVEGCA